MCVYIHIYIYTYIYIYIHVYTPYIATRSDKHTLREQTFQNSLMSQCESSFIKKETIKIREVYTSGGSGVQGCGV